MKKGYVAISSVLIIGAVATVIGIAVTLFSISEGQSALSGQRREAVLDFVEACVEDSLYSININNNVGATVVLPMGTCNVTINSHTGANWTYTVSGTLNGYTKNIQIITTRSNTITPISWKEV